MAKKERLLELAPPYPATTKVTRKVRRNATVSYRGNHYSVLPGLMGSTVLVTHRLGSNKITISSQTGVELCVHERIEDGLNKLSRLPDHHKALEEVVLLESGASGKCDKKANIPPSEKSKKLRDKLKRQPAFEPAVDLSIYAAIVEGDVDD